MRRINKMRVVFLLVVALCLNGLSPMRFGCQQEVKAESSKEADNHAETIKGEGNKTEDDESEENLFSVDEDDEDLDETEYVEDTDEEEADEETDDIEEEDVETEDIEDSGNDDLTAVYEITDTWEGHYNMEVTLHNTSCDVIDDWEIHLDFKDKIETIWNAEVSEEDLGKSVTIKNVSHNQDIPMEGEVKFGMTVAYTGEIQFPTNLYSTREMQEIDVESYSVEYVEHTRWERDGKTYIQGQMKLTNRWNKKIEDWKLDINAKEDILGVENLWGAEEKYIDEDWLSLDNGEYNQNINPGESVQFGFTLQVEEDFDIEEITLYHMKHVTYVDGEDVEAVVPSDDPNWEPDYDLDDFDTYEEYEEYMNSNGYPIEDEETEEGDFILDIDENGVESEKWLDLPEDEVDTSSDEEDELDGEDELEENEAVEETVKSSSIPLLSQYQLGNLNLSNSNIDRVLFSDPLNVINAKTKGTASATTTPTTKPVKLRPKIYKKIKFVKPASKKKNGGAVLAMQSYLEDGGNLYSIYHPKKTGMVYMCKSENGDNVKVTRKNRLTMPNFAHGQTFGKFDVITKKGKTQRKYVFAAETKKDKNKKLNGEFGRKIVFADGDVIEKYSYNKSEKKKYTDLKRMLDLKIIAGYKHLYKKKRIVQRLDGAVSPDGSTLAVWIKYENYKKRTVLILDLNYIKERFYTGKHKVQKLNLASKNIRDKAILMKIECNKKNLQPNHSFQGMAIYKVSNGKWKMYLTSGNTGKGNKITISRIIFNKSAQTKAKFKRRRVLMPKLNGNNVFSSKFGLELEGCHISKSGKRIRFIITKSNTKKEKTIKTPQYIVKLKGSLKKYL